ncbi:FCD domain-containing protein [bacterium]|nr:FCD domain-containing protein [bacterium]
MPVASREFRSPFVVSRISETMPQNPVADRTAESLPVSRVALKQQAYLQLKSLILSNELLAGSVQSVRQLALQLGMSKTPVHAAIERLEAEGFVTLAPQQGVVIRELSIQDIVNHYEIRQALEPYVMRRLAGRLSSPQSAKLQQNLADTRRYAEHQNRAGLMEADAGFHQLLTSFLRNDEITRVMQQLRDKVQRVIFRVADQFPERMIETANEHQAIVDALIDGNAEVAARYMHEHLEQGLRRFLPNRS